MKKSDKLIAANKELAFQNEKKEKRAAELIIANKELAFQNKEKGKRIKTEESLRETNEYLENLFRYANAPIIVWDTQFNITRFNPAFEVLTGRKSIDVIEHSIDILFPAELVENSMELILKAQEGERWETVEIKILHLDGSIKTLLWNSASVLGIDGKTPVATIAQGQDITDRKRAEDEVRQSRKEMDSLFEASPEMISFIGFDGYFKRLNPAWVKTLGYPMEKLLSIPFIEFVHPDDREATNAEAAKLAEGQRTIQFDNRYRCNDGSFQWLSWSVIPDTTEKLLYAVTRDITERKKAEVAISETELKFRTIFDKASDGIIIAENGSSTFYMANNKICEMLGYTQNELLKIGLIEIHLEKDLPYVIEQFERMGRNEIAHATDIPVMRKDGSLFYADINSSSVNLGGKDYLIGIFRDITDRKQIEEQLHESEVKFRNVFENSPLGKSLTGVDGTLSVNKAFCDILGYSEEELKIKKWIELTHPDDIQESKDIVQSLIKGEKSNARYEKRYLHKNGNIIWTDVITTLQRDKNDSPLFFITTINDITERKIADEKIRQLKDELEDRVIKRTDELKDVLELNQTVIESSSLGIFACREDGPCIIANSAVARISGATVEQMLQLNFRNLDSWKENGLFEKVENALHTKKEQHSIIHITSTFGKDIWIKYYITTFTSGGILHFLMIVEDITERMLAEQELEKYRKHLEELVNERTAKLADAIVNLELSNKELEQFAYVASHDLQEPLRMVSSFTQLLERRYKDKLDQDANDFIQYAVDGANRMQKLINDLLDYSRITSRGKDFAKVDISQVLGQAISNLQQLIIENTALITNEDLPELKADESQILRVFQNLIENALKFKKKTELPKIHISCIKRNDFYEFAVSDNGIGMDMQFHDRVFTIFQRLHSKEEYPGTGIGLSICKRIVERHGGKIWFESKENEGTTFYFTLKN